MKQKRFSAGIFSLVTITLITVTIILFFPSSVPAKPTIIWTPSSIEETVSPGESKTVTVNFTSSKDVNDVVVRVVPELEPFVQVEPASFSELEKGETVDFSITISAGQESELGTFDGTIQLRSGIDPEKTFAKPLPVVVNVWQSYSEHEITVYYPPDYYSEVIQGSSGSSLHIWESDHNFKEGLPPSFTTVIQAIDLQGEPLESFVTEALGPLITINGTIQGFLEVFEPSIGEGLFHHFLYLAERKVLVDVIAKTSDHDDDPEFEAILQKLEL